MSFIFYWQQTGGEDPWIEALAGARQDVIAKRKPAFVTVLDLSQAVTAEMSREDILAIRYAGDFYADFDAPDIDTAIAKVQQLAQKLIDMGVDPDAVRWFATGGRGFHVEVPLEHFLPKVPPKGIQHLPLIFREVAFELYVDTMDMRVYSAKRGRMWRTPGVARSNGKYKVAVTYAELAAMTPASYDALCAAPRPAPAVAKPALNSDLGLIYEKARLKVEAGAKKRAAGTKDIELLKRFKGDWPPTMKRIMQGDGVKSGAGFHHLAMQIAITANAIGKDEKMMLEAAEGLIQNHVSDSYRYNTPKKRRDELARLFEYTKDNVCYGYSKGAVKVLVADGIDTTDLDGMPDDAGANLATPVTDELDLRGGLEMRETGLYKRDQEGVIQLICDLAFKNVTVLLSLPQVDKPSELWGFETDVYLKGKLKGRQHLDMQVFLSKQRFQEFALRNMGVMKGVDNDVASLATILRDMGMNDGKVSYVTRREGLDYVVRPEADPPQRDLIWVESSGVYGATTVPYVFRPQVPSGSVFQSDIFKAPELEGNDEERAFLEALFNINDPNVIAPMLGWFVSCYHRMIYEALFGKFPLMMPFGQQGSGKTETTLLLANLHFYSTDPLNLSCADLTPYYLQVHASASASIPLILDEYKPRSMKHNRMREVLPNSFRASYNNGAFGKGGEGEQIGQSWKSISKLSYSAPVVFIGEAIESESAIMERTVAVPMSKAGVIGKGKHYKVASAGRKILARVGRSVLGASFGIDFERFRERVLKNVEFAGRLFQPDTNHRPVYNLGVVLTGFDFFSEVVRHKFGGALDGELARLRESILREPAEISGTIIAEASKVLNALSYMSNNEDSTGPYSVREGYEYTYTSQAGLPCVDLRMQQAWVKYAAWCRNKGQEALYDNYEAFATGLAHYLPLVDKSCIDSPLKTSGLMKVYRFSLQKLTDEGVQAFKGQLTKS